MTIAQFHICRSEIDIVHLRRRGYFEIIGGVTIKHSMACRNMADKS